MQMKELDWGGLSCSVPQEYVDRGFNLLEGGQPWICPDTEDLNLVVTESWFCDQINGWMFTDIHLKFDDLFYNFCKLSKETTTTEECEEEKKELITALNKLIKKIESF